jgi:hypothetical protein
MLLRAAFDDAEWQPGVVGLTSCHWMLLRGGFDDIERQAVGCAVVSGG